MMIWDGDEKRVLEQTTLALDCLAAVGGTIALMLKTNPVYFRAEGNFRAAARKRRQNNLLPFCGIVLGSMTRRTDGYNPFALRHLGVNGRRDLPSKFIHRYRLTPITLEATLRFISISVEDAIFFSQAILQAPPRIPVSVASGHFNIGINFAFDSSVAFTEPDQTLSPATIQEISLVINAYTGVAEKVRVIEKVYIGGHVVAQPAGEEVSFLTDEIRASFQPDDDNLTE